jgi:putative xylitol transport system substrate-binding protein
VPSRFTLTTRTRIPIERLFDASLSIDEHVASMSQSGERAIAGTTTGTTGLGETVTWRARHFGIWFTMTSKITELEKPTRFVDQQVRGPFKTSSTSIDLKQSAADAGIPVIGSNTRVNSDLLTSYVGSDDTISGYMEAKTVLDKLGCKGNVVILEGPVGQSAQISRLEGNKKALAECPEVKVLEDQTANWSRAEAQTLMENWLTAHPKQINGVIGQNDEMALGAIEAIKAAGLDEKSFAIAGIDGITDALRAVKAGEMTSILQDARAQAQGALDLAIFHAKKGNYKPQSDIWATYKDMPWNDGKDKNYNVPWTPVTADNVDKLLATRK